MNSTSIASAFNGMVSESAVELGLSFRSLQVFEITEVCQRQKMRKTFGIFLNRSCYKSFRLRALTATAKVTFTPLNDGELTGLIVTGLDYAYLSVAKKQYGLYISQTLC